jgi:CubicO group peptidase (beta-lactamase class C family)
VSDRSYFPVSERDGGWRWLDPADAATAGMDPRRLAALARTHELLFGGFSWAMAIVRHGYLVQEIASFNVLSTTRFDLWSGTKSFAATAWGLLLSGRLDVSPPTLDTAIYDLIPEGQPLTDPGKAHITVGQVLSMTGGFQGERGGALGTPTDVTAGPFEHALGRAANRYGVRADRLAAEPGTRWDYSDVGYCHLTLAFANVTGREIADVMQQHVFTKIGIEKAAWDVQGGGGYLGPHTNPHTGLHLSARELARFGYLALHGGEWAGEQVIPADWQAIATRPSQELNGSYGYGWWTNAHDTYVPGAPTDLIAIAGFAGNRCYIIPSLDLVIARVGTGPFVLDERNAVLPIVDAVVD